MDEIRLDVFRMLHFGNKVGRGDVDEIARGERQQEADIVACREIISDKAPEDHREAGDEIEPERLGFLPATVDKDAEVSQFLRNLVRGAGNPCDDADAEIHKEGSGDGKPVDEIMQPVRYQDEICHRLLVLAWRFVAVVPVDGLLEQQKEGKAYQYPGPDRLDISHFFYRFRDHMEERASQKGAGGHGDQRQDYLVKRLLFEI